MVSEVNAYSSLCKMQCVSDYSMHFENLGIQAVTIRILG